MQATNYLLGKGIETLELCYIESTLNHYQDRQPRVPRKLLNKPDCREYRNFNNKNRSQGPLKSKMKGGNGNWYRMPSRCPSIFMTQHPWQKEGLTQQCGAWTGKYSE